MRWGIAILMCLSMFLPSTLSDVSPRPYLQQMGRMMENVYAVLANVTVDQRTWNGVEKRYRTSPNIKMISYNKINNNIHIKCFTYFVEPSGVFIKTILYYFNI